MLKPKKAAVRKTEPKIAITELNVRKTATRLLSAKLVSTEVFYIQHSLGTSATQQELDAKVLAVRSMPWADLVIPE